MRESPARVKFADLLWLCTELFGEPRNRGTSHYVFKTPWALDPRVNIQPDRRGSHGKPYQVRQVVAAIDKLREECM